MVAPRRRPDYPHAMDRIRIEGLELRCIVGTYSYERRREQPLHVFLELGTHLAPAGRSGRIQDTIDYSRIADITSHFFQFRAYRLLEVAAEELAALLFAAYPILQEVRIRLEKPEALNGRARAAIEIFRPRSAFHASESWSARTDLLRSHEAWIEAVHLKPGETGEFNDPYRRFEWALGAPSLTEPTPLHTLTLSPSESSRYQAPAQEGLTIVRCLELRSSPACPPSELAIPREA